MGLNRDIARIDIWRAAKLLVNQHGADAPLRAAQRADEMLARGDWGAREARGVETDTQGDRGVDAARAQ